MRTIARLFGKSPFAPLNVHLGKVHSCVLKLQEMLLALQNNSNPDYAAFVKEISKLEYEADLTKNDLRNHLPKSLFLPIDRYDLLQILHIQDSIADSCEHIAITLTLSSTITIPEGLRDDFKAYVDKTLETFDKAHLVILEFDNLIASTFGGTEAEKVRAMSEQVALLEHQTFKIKNTLLRKLFGMAEQMPYHTFYLWLKLFEEIARVSKLSEHLCGRVRMVLDIS